jgi:hypothetical protein
MVALLRAATAAGSTLCRMDAAQRVAQIVEATEQAVEQMRADAEARARERIAEADRAAAYRVQAAEDEAAEVLAAARAEAARLTAEAQELRRLAESEQAALIAEGRRLAEVEAEQVRANAAQLLERAREEARATTSDARTAAREVLADGGELSTDLRDLSSSLRSNAERLLRDIKLVHASMTTRLDQASPGRAVESDPRPRRSSAGGEELDVPEFMPGR